MGKGKLLGKACSPGAGKAETRHESCRFKQMLELRQRKGVGSNQSVPVGLHLAEVSDHACGMSAGYSRTLDIAPPRRCKIR